MREGEQGRLYEAVVIGASAGGIEAVGRIFSKLPQDFSLPVLVVIHQHPNSKPGSLEKTFTGKGLLQIKEADDKDPIVSGTVYLAPPNYHLLVEDDRTLSLNVDEKVNFSRPAIDVLFKNAAEVYRDKVIGIILTGASQDGAAGLKKIMEAGGLIMIQDPVTAEADAMPRAAQAACNPKELLSLDEISRKLAEHGKWRDAR